MFTLKTSTTASPIPVGTVGGAWTESTATGVSVLQDTLGTGVRQVSTACEHVDRKCELCYFVRGGQFTLPGILSTISRIPSLELWESL